MKFATYTNTTPSNRKLTLNTNYQIVNQIGDYITVIADDKKERTYPVKLFTLNEKITNPEQLKFESKDIHTTENIDPKTPSTPCKDTKTNKKPKCTFNKYTPSTEEVKSKLVYEPVKIRVECLHSNGFYVLISTENVPINLQNVDDLHEFVGLKNDKNIKFSTTSSKLGIRKADNKILATICTETGGESITRYKLSNSEALQLATTILAEIEYINKKLVLKLVEEKTVYYVEHEPDGRNYKFRSNEALKIGDTVVCETSRGKQYGVVVGRGKEPVNIYNTRSLAYKK